MNKTLEEMLVEQCAPTLAGVKPANLFRCADNAELYHSVQEWNNHLRASSQTLPPHAGVSDLCLPLGLDQPHIGASRYDGIPEEKRL